MVIIYHNEACTKSNMALQLLQKKGIAFELRNYLAQPLDEAELRSLLAKLSIPAEHLIRKNESLYQQQYEGRQQDEAGWIAAMVANPVLIERPVVENNGKAVIARPAEKILEIL